MLLVVRNIGDSANSPSVQIFVIVVAGLLLAYLTWLGKRTLTRHNERLLHQDAAFSKLDSMYTSFVGEEATLLNPDPKPGFVKVLLGHTKSIDDLTERQNAANGTALRTEQKVDNLIAAGVVTKLDLEAAARKIADETKVRQDEVIETVKTEVAAVSEVSTANKDEIVAAVVRSD